MDGNRPGLGPGLPLSLQDMCMLRIMLRLEEFSTDSLALLPAGIIRRLFLGLAHADLLHVDVLRRCSVTSNTRALIFPVNVDRQSPEKSF